MAAGTVAILMTTMAGAMPDSWLGASTAHACGGLFCNSSQPVNQAAERIIFAQAADGTVTAVIQIMYQGPSEEFAWVLPVEGAPEVRVSADLALQRLQSATNPVYRMTTRTDGTCAVSSFADAGAGAAFDASAVADASAADAGVSVVGAGSVGPYDYVIISTDPSLPEAGDVAVEWLGDNGYDVDSRTAETLGPYLEGGSNLLAFRLTKGRDVGAIRPVMIGFGAGLPMIPIRPTAVAANRDMGILVWLLGGDRAVPVNYKSLELNEALINWFSPNGNYDAVVTAAADQAGGQGFVTELAGGAARFADAVYQDWERDRWQATRGADWLGEEGLLLNRVLGDLASWDGIRDAVRETVPLPSGATYDDLFACVSCYYDRTVADIDGFEPEAFLAAVEVHVIGPMEDTRQLFLEHGYVTRLYTTMSAEEMTMDPVFDFNAELGDVSNVHTAERVIHCSPSFTSGEAPWSIELPEGDVVWGTQNQWPFGLAAMPANRRILRVGDTGQGNVVEDHTEAIAAAIAEHNRTVPGSPTGPSPEGSPTDRADGGGGGSDATGGGGGDGTGGAGSAGGGCAVQGLATPGAGAGAHGEALLGLLAALLLASRRRR